MTRTGEYLGKLFAHMGKECYIEPPFYCDYGTNIHVGDYFYANTGLIVLDQCDVIIGDHAFLGPTVINPGVTIGSNVVIGSGSVVTKDIPDSVIAAGNPCKVIRMITNKDKEYWLKQLEEFEADTGEQVKLEQD